MSSDYQGYCEHIEELGFQVIYEENFPGNGDSGFEVIETYRIYWNPKGYLLTAESFSWGGGPKDLNRATLYYNIQVTDEQINDLFKVTSSGSYVVWDETNREYVWGGDHTVDYGPQLVMENLERHGMILPIPRRFTHLWLVNYHESKQGCSEPSEDRHVFYDACRNKKIACFPSPLKEYFQSAVKAPRVHIYQR